MAYNLTMPRSKYRINPPVLPKLSERLVVGKQGRVVLPAKLRKALRLQVGDELLASVEDGQLVIRRDEQLDHQLWEKFGRIRGSMAEELIKERRGEAKREAK